MTLGGSPRSRRGPSGAPAGYASGGVVENGVTVWSFEDAVDRIAANNMRIWLGHVVTRRPQHLTDWENEGGAL